MKKNATINKLQLNKTTISELNNTESNEVKGGATGLKTVCYCPVSIVKFCWD